jgi:hypothetical protein
VKSAPPSLLGLSESGLGCTLTVLLLALFLGAVGLGWVVNGILIVLALLLLAPAIGFFGLRWWLGRNLILSNCPVCSYEFTGFRESECVCPSCGEKLLVSKGQFTRATPAGTIDVEAIEVSPHSGD